MESISPNELAIELLNHCLRGSAWPEDLLDALAADALDEDPALAAPATKAIFSVVVERLADLFEPRLCDTYAALFSRIIAKAFPDEVRADELVARYRDVRTVRPVSGEPARVVVLSRVTLGADVAVTSLFLDAAKQRFPKAQILFAAPSKAWELFERDPRLEHLQIPYGRTSLLRDRLSVYQHLRRELSQPGTLVLDPDSRLTQLGLLPVCPAGQHFLFESRSYGGDSSRSITDLATEWLQRTLGVEEPVPYLHPRYNFNFGATPVLTASFGVGENPAKRVEDPFEASMAQAFAETKAQSFIDKGIPGSEESLRVQDAIASVPLSRAERIGVHEGSFASFAAMIAASGVYFGYDSAGQHVAAALGVPLVSVFNGFASERMLARWTPEGPGPITILRADGFASVEEVAGHARAAIREHAQSL